MGEISTHGSHSLPNGRPKVVGTADIIQMPPRSLKNTTERRQRHAESDDWFNEANQHVTSQLDGLGDDAPYFPDEIEPANLGEKQSSPSHLDDPVLSYMRAGDSERENEELRGIIDDLTLDIKRLKQKLRRYKERDPPRLQGDKLFDVRTYGLPRQRKRQLEQILQQFAAEISGSSRLSRERPTRTKSKHLRDNAHISDDDARKALVAMLFKQHLGLLAAKASIQRIANISPSSDSWYDINEVLSSIKHMISNIDVEFSREALEKYGAALELSADGHRVRWQSSNRHEIVRPHTGSSVIHDYYINSHQANDLPKETSIHHENVLGLAESRTTSLRTPATTDYIPYKSKTHKNEADDDVVSMISSGSEMSSQAPVSDGAGRFSTTRPQTHKTSHERLTYYKNATFYIDCYGDRLDAIDSQPQASSLTESVGEKRKRQSSDHLSRQQRRHTNKTPADRFHSYPNEKDSVLNLSQCTSPVLSLAEEPLTSVADGHKAFPMELAASGVGDVTPDDNFALHVVMKHVPVSSSDEPETSRISKDSFKDGFPGHDQRNGKINNRNKKLFKTYVVTATHEELAPSSLPPATCGIFSSASSDDDSDDDDGDDGDNDFDGVYEKQGQVNLPDVSHAVLAHAGGIGESPASAHSIEKWNAQVVASLGNHGENAVVP
ncbi:Frequency clock protein [Talaromyces pinophilus]|nr:Frequency clock protein [Talaromyces pinophilus]